MDIKILKNSNVLFVEDEESLRNLIADIFNGVGVKVDFAVNGLEGLEKFQNNKYDIIVTDISMPKMNGLDMLDNIRKADTTTPAVIVSAHNDQDFLKKAIDTKVSGFCMKPLDISNLIETMTKALESNYLKKNLEKEITEKTLQIRNILDSQENIIILSDGKKIIDGNVQLLKFLDIKSLKDEELPLTLVTDKFELAEDYLNSDEKTENWIQKLQDLSDIHRVVKVKVDEEYKVYTVNINSFETDVEQYVISMSDVTMLHQKKQELEYEVNHDHLTQLYNRQKLNHILDYEFKKRERGLKSFFSLIMFDIDNFKHINDTYGHDIGDEVLIEFANIIKQTSRRDIDFAARWGGEEFMILLYNSVDDEVMTFAEKIRANIENHHFNKVEKVTASFGVSKALEDDTKKTLLKRVDEALYYSKKHGKNMVKFL